MKCIGNNQSAFDCPVHDPRKQSHGMDFESENKHLDEDKAWGEFMLFFHDHARINARNYSQLMQYQKVGILIEFIKTKQSNYNFNTHMLNANDLEKHVKSLKPVEPVDEVDELGKSLRIEASQYSGYGTDGYWRAIANKAIEIIKGKA